MVPSHTSKIKILHLITDLDVGGAEIFLHKLLSVIDRDTFDNLVVSMTDIGIIGKKIQKLGFSVSSLGMRKGFPSFKGFKVFSKILKQEKPDIIQTWMYHADLLGVLTARKQKPSKLIWNIRCSNVNFSQYRRLTSWVVKLCVWFSSCPDAVIVNSLEGYKHHLSLGYHPKRWEIIPNGFDSQKFAPDNQARKAVRKELGLTEKSFLIGMIARMDPMKDHPTFLMAAVQLARKYPNVYFILVGEGITDHNPLLKFYLTKDVLANRLFLLGYREDIAKITASLDIATSSSQGEGFSNVIGEAMACGIPCVVTDVGDSAYLVQDTGLVIPPNNPWSMAEAWESLLNLPLSDREELGLKAMKRIKKVFDLHSINKRYEELYCDLI